jgi:4-amino-4-deoxy-L-arabinose transferase-like glycosyltransferase
MRLPLPFWLILTTALVLRLALASFAPHPGISDPNHYYNLGRNVAAGQGFVIDYIYQYHRPPAAVTHPEDYWMPLPALWPAIGLRLFGNTLWAALIPSAVLGSLLSVLAYGIAAAAGLEQPARLIAMSTVAFLPEFVLNSVRTDTTLSYTMFAGLAGLCFFLGMKRRPWLLLVAGISGGLTQLSRQDGILLAPALLISMLVLWRVGKYPMRWYWPLLIALGWFIVLLPWLWRNFNLFGEWLPAGSSRTLFMTSFNDQFTYGRVLDLDHYLAWGWPNILGNIAFQALANVKTSYTVLDVALPITALLGLGGLVVGRDRERLSLLLLPFVLVLLLYLFYSFLVPFHTMGGSFKKSYMSLVPYLAMTSAWGIIRYIQPRRTAYLFAALMVGIMGLNAVELVRADYNQSGSYDATIAALGEMLARAGDRNGDGKITVMAQDPFILNYHGFPALIIPSDDRDTILEAAYRYQVDYIILPAARPALDSLYDGVETDPRLTLLESRGSYYQLLAVAGPSS